MKKMALTVVTAILAIVSISAMARSGPVREGGTIPGSAVKWIHAAEPEFQRQKLDINRYNVSVSEDDDSATVMLLNFNQPKGVRGNPGPLPEYEVTLSKKDMRVVSESYVR